MIDYMCQEKKEEDSADASIRQLENYIKNTKERLITAVRKNKDSKMINRTPTRKRKWKEKQLYEYFKLQTSEIL